MKIELAYTFSMLWVVRRTGIEILSVPGAESFYAEGLVGLLYKAPDILMEEIVYRLPLVLLVMLNRSLGTIMVFAVLLSVMFAFPHGGTDYILIQGVGGLILSLLFLKCGGWQGKPMKALAATFIAHMSYNASLILINMFF